MEGFTEEQEVAKVDFGNPHCFLLGAGASLAAFPNGDKNGKALPLMNNFVETLGLEPYFERAGIGPPYDDFEAIYSELSLNEANAEAARDLEKVIYQYF